MGEQAKKGEPGWMFEFLFEEHPTPWKYVSNHINRYAAIVDTNDMAVVLEGQVPQVVFDSIWTIYVYFGKE